MLLLALLAGVVATGCGGGSSGSGSTSATQAKGSTQAHTQATPGASTPSSPAHTQPGATTSTPTAAGDQAAIAAANAICKRRNSELTAIRDPGMTNLRALARATRRQAAIEQRALSELERLTPPAAIAALYRKLLAYDQVALLAAVKVGEAAQSGNARAARSAKTSEQRGRLRVLITGVRAGLRECSRLR